MSRLRLAIRAVGLLLLLPVCCAAQDWNMPWSDGRDRPARVDLSLTAGFLAPTDWSDLVLLGSVSSATGVLEQMLARDIRVEPESVFSVAATYWRGRYGFRTQAGRSKSSLIVGNDEFIAGLETWLYDVRGAIALVDYHPRRWVLPYAFLGAGGITYNLSETVSPPLLTFISQAPPAQGQRSGIVVVGDRQLVVATNELRRETVFAVNFGIGTDFRLPLGPAGVGVRLELSDHLARSPLHLSIHELSRFGVPFDPAVRFGLVHHLRADAGLIVQLGR